MNRFSRSCRVRALPLVATLSGALLLSACGGDAPSTAPTASALDGQPVAMTINGLPIPQALVDAYSRQLGQNAGDADQVMEQIIEMVVVYQQALKEGLDRQIEVAAELESLRIDRLAVAMMRKELERSEPSEAVLREEYDSLMAGRDFTEFRASHILLDNEEDARAVITELDAGADFAELARTRSTGPSGPQGGELGWFTADDMVAPFSAAVAAMEPGQHSTNPVQTQFGWHVIQLHESREGAPPSFEEVSPQLRQLAIQNHLQDYIDNLRAQATIERR